MTSSKQSTGSGEPVEIQCPEHHGRPVCQEETWVLVVDDDRAIRDVLRRHLKSAGYRVRTAEDAIEAITLFDEHGADLVILDVKMPGMDGFEVCETIKKTNDVPIIFLTGAQEPMVKQYLSEIVKATGGDHFLLKPCDIRELVQLVDYVLRDR